MTSKTRGKSKSKDQTTVASTTPPSRDGVMRPYEPGARVDRRRPSQTSPSRNIAFPLLVGALLLIGLSVGLLFLLGIIRFSTAAEPAPGSPDGRILFMRTAADGTRNLFIVNPDGQGQVQVTQDLLIEGSWSWSPDGRFVVVQVNQGGQSEIARLTLGPDNRATETVSLTADIDADAAFPTWSPDGTKIAFQHKAEGGFQVFVMDTDGTNKRKVSGGTGYAGLPDWSYDSKRLVFIAGNVPDVGTPKELYVADVDAPAASPTKVTALGMDISRPSWSPDGTQLAYIERQGDRAGSIMLVGLDGLNPRRLGDSAAQSTPQFSPAGDRIVAYNVAPPEGSDIYLLSLGAGEPINITPGQGDDYVPVWSPDGSKLAWASVQPAQSGHKIVVADADGSNVRAVSSGEGDDSYPTWVAADQLDAFGTDR